MTHSRKFVATLACCIGASAVIGGGASAGQIFQERYHDEGSLVHENFCGAAGLTVSDEFVIDGKVRAVPRGPDGLAYFLDKHKETSVVTNLANGKAVTYVLNFVSKDMKATSNGDGTLTIVVMATGNVVVYGANGKAIARDPGQVRFEILIDDGGTPTDPSDDEYLGELGNVKPSNGRNDDICAASVAAIT